MYLRKIKIFCFLLLTFMLVSCHSKKNISSTDYTEESSEWTTLYAPLNINIEKPSPMSLSTRATMKNGEYIHLSMRFLGMEVAAAYIDNDSIFFVDKYHKYIFAEPLTEVLGQKYSNLNIADIQNIFLGRTQVNDNPNGKITTSDFVKTPVGLIASYFNVIIETADGDMEGNIEWNPASAKWNEPNRSASFKAPSNYQRITSEGLRGALKSMTF